MELHQVLIAILLLTCIACKSSFEKPIATKQTTTKQTTNAENTTKSTAIHKVNAKIFLDKLGALPNEQIVDVRTFGEFAKGAINDAVNINYYDGDFGKQAGAQLDKNKPVMLYCAGGTRSAKAAKVLEKQGFTEIYDLEKGYKGWGNK